jgi:hypothetical protein
MSRISFTPVACGLPKLCLGKKWYTMTPAIWAAVAASMMRRELSYAQYLAFNWSKCHAINAGLGAVAVVAAYQKPTPS